MFRGKYWTANNTLVNVETLDNGRIVGAIVPRELGEVELQSLEYDSGGNCKTGNGFDLMKKANPQKPEGQ